jgi:hypothetical protein
MPQASGRGFAPVDAPTADNGGSERGKSRGVISFHRFVRGRSHQPLSAVQAGLIAYQDHTNPPRADPIPVIAQVGQARRHRDGAMHRDEE